MHCDAPATPLMKPRVGQNTFTMATSTSRVLLALWALVLLAAVVHASGGRALQQNSGHIPSVF